MLKYFNEIHQCCIQPERRVATVFFFFLFLQQAIKNKTKIIGLHRSEKHNRNPFVAGKVLLEGDARLLLSLQGQPVSCGVMQDLLASCLYSRHSTLVNILHDKTKYVGKRVC